MKTVRYAQLHPQQSSDSMQPWHTAHLLCNHRANDRASFFPGKSPASYRTPPSTFLRSTNERETSPPLVQDRSTAKD